MKSSLAYIDNHVDKMLQREFESPTPHIKSAQLAAKPRIIAGFEVPDHKFSEDVIARAKAARRDQVRTYIRLKEELTEMIAECGVRPLAVLPTVAFDMICRQSDLYFVPKKMRTEVNAAHFLNWMSSSNEQTDQVEKQRGVNSMRKKADRTPEGYLEVFGREEVMKQLLTLPVHGLETEDQEVARRLAEARGTALFMPAASRQASPTDGKTYQLLLPIPPDDVCDTLLKLEQFELKTVAVFGAVDFVGGVAPVLREVQRLREEREVRVQERVDWTLFDPIVYITRGSVTAVVAQFGPFPIEQKIVNMIGAAEFLPA